jgi:mRNA interferase RelE/StbE
MGINFIVAYHELVLKEDIPKLSSVDKQRIKKSIEVKLMTKPEIFGKPLRYSLKGYKKLRIGDYRAVFRIEKETVIIFYIGHRSIAYKKVIKRIE